MVSKIEPDRYADTGFSVRDTSPEINQIIFHRTMARPGSERIMMGFDMLATARAIVWSRIPTDLPEEERRRRFFEEFYGEPCPF